MNRRVPPYTHAVSTEYHGGTKQICNKSESVDRRTVARRSAPRPVGVRINEAAIRSHLIPSTALIANEESRPATEFLPGGHLDLRKSRECDSMQAPKQRSFPSL
jgi:hypothetical protein